MLKKGHDLSDLEIRRLYEQRRLEGAAFHSPSAVFDLALAAIGRLSPASVLEVGCGDGDFLLRLQTLLPKADLVGMDIHADKKWRGRPGKNFLLGSAVDALPFSSDAFDAVVCLETLEHTKRPDGVLAELARVCRPGGRVVVTVPNATGYFPFSILSRVGRFVPGRWLQTRLLPYEHPLVSEQPIDTCFTFRDIRRLFDRAPLRVERIYGARYFRPLEMLPLARAAYRLFSNRLTGWMESSGLQRFAYNLCLVCAPSRSSR